MKVFLHNRYRALRGMHRAMRAPLLAALVLCASLPWTAGGADAACPSQFVHTYVAGPSAGGHVRSLLEDDLTITGVVAVADSNEQDCDGDGVPGDWDGDLDLGVGGAFFGHGPWANEPVCQFGLNVHGPNVVVADIFYGFQVFFVVGEDDRNGPVLIQDPVTLEWVCLTDGIIAPGDAATDPTRDPDDCVSDVFRYGVGRTCGQGGGDGGFWVLLLGAYADEYPDATPPGTRQASIPWPDERNAVAFELHPDEARWIIAPPGAVLGSVTQGTIVAY